MSEHYEDYGRRALEQVHGEWVRWSDPEYGKSLAPIVGGEVGEPLGESNVAAAERLLAEYLESGDAETYTVGRSGRTWLRGVAVRVFDEAGEVTNAWRAAVDLVIEPLEDYPLLDEDDFIEREWNCNYEVLALDYGDSVDLVVSAIAEHSNYGIGEVVGDHDEVVLLVEQHLAGGWWQDEVVLGGLKHYIEQRKGDLDIPTLAALVRAEEEAA